MIWLIVLAILIAAAYGLLMLTLARAARNGDKINARGGGADK